MKPKPQDTKKKAKSAKGKRGQTDWEAIERQFRIGQKSLRILAVEFGVNASNISRRAKKFGWVQDKSEEIRQRTAAALASQRERNTPTPEEIDVAVKTNVEIITGHRKTIAHGRRMVDLLQTQLEQAASNRDELEGEIESETETTGKDGNVDYKRRSQLKKAISLPAHAGVMRDLSTAMKNLVGLERQAFSIDNTGEGNTDPIGKVLNEVANRAAKLVPRED